MTQNKKYFCHAFTTNHSALCRQKCLGKSAVLVISDCTLSIGFKNGIQLVKKFHCKKSRCFLKDLDGLVWYALVFFKIQFWYLRCCGCPWNRSRQHLATPLKTCHNTEAKFLQGGCSAYPPSQRWRHLRLHRSHTWAVCLPLSPQKGDHPPSHNDNFARTSVCRWLQQKPTASQVEAAHNPEKGGYFQIYLLLDGLA